MVLPFLIAALGSLALHSAHAQTLSPTQTLGGFTSPSLQMPSGTLPSMPQLNRMGQMPQLPTALPPELQDMAASAQRELEQRRQAAAQSQRAQQDQTQQRLQQEQEQQLGEFAPAPEPPNLFQTYIQQTTGKTLEIYGQSLFSRGNAFSEQTAAPIPAEYVVGPGDEIVIKIYGSTVDFDQRVVVDRRGFITLPKVGPVSVAGVKVGDLEATLKRRISKVLTNFNLFVSMGQLRGIEIYVVGQAKRPGKYVVSSLSTVVNALFATGGPNNNGSMRKVELVRDSKVLATVDLYEFLAKGDTSKDRRLLAGDVINIPKAGPLVALTGAIPTPAIFELGPTSAPTVIQDLVGLAGGLAVQTSIFQVSLERIQPGNDKPLAVESLTLNEAGLKTQLKDGDILTFFPFKPAFENAVTLRILQADPFRVPILPEARVKDVIPSREVLLTSDYYFRKFSAADPKTDPQLGKLDEAARIRLRNQVDQVNWDQAIIERQSQEDLSTHVIPFNLGKAILEDDPEHNLLLMPGDTIIIFSHRDVNMPLERRTRIVKLQGEVNMPGFYQIAPGETLVDLINRAGGVTKNAYLFGTELSRQSVKARQTQNLQLVIRQLEDQLRSNLASSIASAQAGAELAAAQALAERNTQAARAQIDRLKTLRPSGRISLEMDPGKAAFPVVLLEDGDEILIPQQPGYVMAVGAVYNDNVLIYREGRRVRDYLRVSGVSETAERDNTFVLRADGSIVTWAERNVEKLKLLPGDTIVVPEKYYRESGYTVFMRGLKDWTQVIFQLGLSAAAINVLK